MFTTTQHELRLATDRHAADVRAAAEWRRFAVAQPVRPTGHPSPIRRLWALFGSGAPQRHITRL